MRRAGFCGRVTYTEKAEAAKPEVLDSKPEIVAPVVQELVSDYSDKSGELLVSEPPLPLKEDKKNKKKKRDFIIEEEQNNE